MEKNEKAATAEKVATIHTEFAGRNKKIICGVVVDGKGNEVIIEKAGEKETSQGKKFDLFTVNGGELQFNSPQLKAALSIGNYDKLPTPAVSGAKIIVNDAAAIPQHYERMTAQRAACLETIKNKLETLQGLCGIVDVNFLDEIASTFVLPTFESYEKICLAEIEAQKAKREAAEKEAAEKAAEKARKETQKAVKAMEAVLAIATGELKAQLETQIAALKATL